MTQEDIRKNKIFEDIRFILRDFLKIIKVISLYPENNPLPQSMKRSFAERLVEITGEYDDIEIKVEKNNLFYKNEEVYADQSKEDKLAGLFFEAGITSFTFKQTLTPSEIYKLLDVIKNYINNPLADEDLVNKIWESGIRGFSLVTIEDINLTGYSGQLNIQEFMENFDETPQKGISLNDDYLSLFISPDEDSGIISKSLNLDEPGDGGDGFTVGGFEAEPGGTTATALFEEDERERLNLATAVEAMGYADCAKTKTVIPDTALLLKDEFNLSVEEEQEIRNLISEDATFDMYESTSALLKELLLHETDLSGFSETAVICEKIIGAYVRTSKLFEADLLLKYIRDLKIRLTDDRPRWSERLQEVLLTIGSRDALLALAETLNAHPDIGSDELRRYMENFTWEAFSGLTDLLGELEHRSHRDTLCNYLSNCGRDKVAIISRGINDKRWFVVRNTVIILARIGDEAALGYLRKAVKHENQKVRLALVASLQESPSEQALDILGLLVADEDDEVRTEAVRAIVARRGQKAFAVITDIINDDNFHKLAYDNRRQLLNAYSIIGGDHALEFLSQLILKINPFRDSELTFYRQAAFEALSLNRSDKCERFLIKLTSSWRPGIKQMASETLKKRRQMIYGG
ncbi:MAG: HEAT repeat domain-containing protein [Candidatus Zixiibacteriota bacterium]